MNNRALTSQAKGGCRSAEGLDHANELVERFKVQERTTI